MRCAFSWATRPATANGCDPDGNPAGGDIACAVVAPHGVRLLIGDVMGHDQRAAQTAEKVTRAFRRIAAGPDPLQVVAARLHAFVAEHADGEEFVTAQFVSIPNGDDDAQIVCCGHPPPLLLRDGRVTALDVLPPSPPLGLLDMGGYSPHADLLGARAGDSVLLYTGGSARPTTTAALLTHWRSAPRPSPRVRGRASGASSQATACPSCCGTTCSTTSAVTCAMTPRCCTCGSPMHKPGVTALWPRALCAVNNISATGFASQPIDTLRYGATIAEGQPSLGPEVTRHGDANRIGNRSTSHP